MGKRQTRIFQADIMPKAAELTGREANVVLANHTTMHGVILAVTAENLQIRDMRLKKHAVPMSQVAEIVIDQRTEW
ncbi:MAG: hypothetical protein MUD08_15000 [Cytophagales bacterium]|nr:hypothetical protein [Cytophagales bacterium]